VGHLKPKGTKQLTNFGMTMQVKTKGAISPSSGIYGVNTGSVENMVNRIEAPFKAHTTNIKEVLNTSAPICISSYIKGGGQRPAAKGNPRRPASFNQTGGFTQGKR
jgi:hypothetical protein